MMTAPAATTGVPRAPGAALVLVLPTLLALVQALLLAQVLVQALASKCVPLLLPQACKTLTASVLLWLCA
jgi:hypothetical protein